METREPPVTLGFNCEADIRERAAPYHEVFCFCPDLRNGERELGLGHSGRIRDRFQFLLPVIDVDTVCRDTDREPLLREFRSLTDTDRRVERLIALRLQRLHGRESVQNAASLCGERNCAVLIRIPGEH